METSYSIVQKESEYRILLTPANLGSLSATVLKVIADRDIDVRFIELMPMYDSGEFGKDAFISYTIVLDKLKDKNNYNKHTRITHMVS